MSDPVGMVEEAFRAMQELRAKGPRAEIKEFRMSSETADDLKRRYPPMVSPVGYVLAAPSALFGIPIIIDPRVPDGTIIPIPKRLDP